uniref:Oxysterol-binding protein n=1 Tax=Saccoglossus kowalevskii TaxID=10224 RepID=A0ABM0M854_SACKO|nr:PREDICTED: oxysterol-binding protein-related protein 9-like [Saccoglossus kowalevskii]
MAAMEGPLSKWTNVMKGWQYRWFVLDPQTGLLSYYTSKEKMMRGSRRGCVRLKGKRKLRKGKKKKTHSHHNVHYDRLHHPVHRLAARDAEERGKWVNGLEETIVRHSQPRWCDVSSTGVPTLEDFDKKLVEADAYLQILIDQCNALEIKIEKCQDEEEKKKYESLKDAAHNLLESIKQSIVLLQLAKCFLSQNAVNPMNGVVQVESFPEDTPNYAEKATRAMGLGAASDPVSQSHQTSPPMSPIKLSSVPAVSYSSPPMSPNKHSSVPAVSYSSSDDEEDFFDADEYLYYEDTQWDSPRDDSPVQFLDTKDVEVKSPDPVTATQMYEEDDDEDDELDCGKHGSVITHLLSQVRIGMDLTKVVLPTFILERRSLLEMFADFFAHPDLFSNIPDYEDPKDRIVQVTRWFLSAFHAGKKGSVAKKPYNPIIGETLQCFYDVSESNGEYHEPAEDELVPDGPVPWATKDQVTFLAEQVSHHPPISAFYAENYNKGLSVNAHIWTKSKFLGLSIGVEMIGQGCLSDLKHDEEYMVTFPNGYGRSILTVPWFEMGGKCSISCAKTGFASTVVFHTKPFYGGSKHRITAEVSHVSDRKPFLTVTGEWNGVMMAKWANGTTETFIDTTTMKTYKKKVKPIDQQGEFESRRLWKDVTYNLKMKNMDATTAAKHKLEERQRAERKERNEKNIKWQTKYFYEDGDNYIYKKPLQKRLDEKLQQLEKEKELQLQQQKKEQAALLHQQLQLQLQQQQVQMQLELQQQGQPPAAVQPQEQGSTMQPVLQTQSEQLTAAKTDHNATELSADSAACHSGDTSATQQLQDLLG